MYGNKTLDYVLHVMYFNRIFHFMGIKEYNQLFVKIILILHTCILPLKYYIARKC